jgi:putative transposase
MARIARVVAAGVPHHVTQRGNRRQQTFFCASDYEAYRTLLAESCAMANVAVLAYCLMPNHVHLVMVPRDEDGLRAALAESHRRYSRAVNFREGWRGYLWQGRFASFPMDENYLLACTRYVELNPVRAKLVTRARDWRWSSARAHLDGRDDVLVKTAPLLDRVDNWKAFLGEGLEPAQRDTIRAAERTGRPLGGPAFVRKLEKKLDRCLTKRKPGPKPASDGKQATLF